MDRGLRRVVPRPGPAGGAGQVVRGPAPAGPGLGRALVERVEEVARARGAPGMELWTDTRFGDAHRLYRRCGFQATGATRQLHDLSETTEYAFHKAFPVAQGA